MQDTASSNQPRSSAREETAAALSRLSGMHAPKVATAAPPVKRRSWLMRLLGFLARPFTGWRKKKIVDIAASQHIAERAATAIASGAEPPMVFRGDTASTLATPMGTYAGKPAYQAIRKRAEQQFKNMDITTSTMN